MEDTVKTEKRGFWNFIDNIKGDKVVWIIVFMLIMISILAVFSSTSLLALQAKTDRLAIIKEQIITAAGGLAVIWAFCRIKRIGVFMMLSQLGFIASFALLALLLMEVDFGEMFKAVKINGVYRALRIFKLQIHVYEFVKVAMVMYLAWAAFLQERSGRDLTYWREFHIRFRQRSVKDKELRISGQTGMEDGHIYVYPYRHHMPHDHAGK